MKKIMRKKTQKKGLSKVKKKTIAISKLQKKGLFGLAEKKKRRKLKKKEQWKQYVQNATMNQNRKENVKNNEITGEEMMEMMDDDDELRMLQSNANIADEDQQDSGNEVESRELLPVLTEDGWEMRHQENEETPNDHEPEDGHHVKSKKRKKSKENSVPGETPKDEAKDASKESEPEQKPKSLTEIFSERKRHVEEKKLEIASLAYNAVLDPRKLWNLRSLLDVMIESDPASELTVRKYATLSLLQVFHDIIPSYRIRDDYKSHLMKKENLETARIEGEMLACYRKYLKTHEQVLQSAKDHPDHFGLQVLTETSVFCLGELIVKHPMFNYGVNIIWSIVPYLNHKTEKIRQITLNALSQTIKNDKSCVLTNEIVQKVYKLVHRNQFRVKREVLEVFLSLRIKEMKNMDKITDRERTNFKALTHKEKLIQKLKEQSKAKPSRSQKKDAKKVAKLKHQMAEIDLQELENAENEKHSQILQAVFGIYFHILKKKPGSRLMSIVLEGLATFAHLINMEFFSDLLAVLNGILERKLLSRPDSLFCIHTIFTILSGQGENLTIDPQRFYNKFYSLMMEVTSGELRQHLGTLLMVMEQMLNKRKKFVSPAKVLSFSKRLATLSLTLPHHLAIPTLVTLKQLFTMFSSTDALLDSDCEGAPGMFNPDIIDPEHAHTAATALWEAVLLKKHYHPKVRVLAQAVVSGSSPREFPEVFSLTRRSFEELMSYYDISKLKFNPPIPPPRQLSNKRKLLNPLFPGGYLDLNDIKLQGICEKVLEEEEISNSLEKRPSKRCKTDNLSLDIYKSLSSKDDDDDYNYDLDKLEYIASKFLDKT